jgi:hypothetical protein
MKSNTKPACHQGKLAGPATDPASGNHDHRKLGLGVRDAVVIDVEDVRARLARRFGPDVAGWCAGLPALAEGLASR